MVPAFSKVCKWLRNNKLSLNTIKTAREFMVIGTMQRLNQLDSSPESTRYAIVADDCQKVKRVKIVKYLGMMVDDKLVWDQHVDYISSKITRNIGILNPISTGGCFSPAPPICFFACNFFILEPISPKFGAFS